MRMRLLRTVLALVASLAAAAPVAAQAVEETRMLREAAARESRGDLDGAARVLQRLLEASPSSSGGLFALDRVLRAKGEVRAILPAVDAFLARDSSASGVRYLKLRVLLELDSLHAVEEEAESWLRAQPGSESAHREVGRIYEQAFGPERAVAVLRRGRATTGREGALALEIGDLLAEAGRVDEAVEEWASAIDADGGQAPTISRRVAALPGTPGETGRKLVEALRRSGDVGRRRAAALIALEHGLGDLALSVSREVARDLDGRARMGFLADVARRARDAELPDVASWAYGELGQDAQSPAERRQFDQRLVEVSLADGDTATALEAQWRVVESFTPGTVDRRRASAQALRLETGSATADRLRGLLDAFREEFPDAPELDEVAAAVAGALRSRGDADAAVAVLEGIQGPRSALQRGYLLLDAGDVAEGRRALMLALPGLAPGDATGVIQFVSLLGRLSPRSAEVLARAGVRAHEQGGVEAARMVTDGIAELPEKEWPALLAEAARMAEQGGAADEAAELRARLLDDYPDAPEATEGALALARYHAGIPGGLDEAIRLLEDLVTRRPNAAVVPDARRELERLRRQGP